MFCIYIPVAVVVNCSETRANLCCKLVLKTVGWVLGACWVWIIVVVVVVVEVPWTAPPLFEAKIKNVFIIKKKGKII